MSALATVLVLLSIGAGPAKEGKKTTKKTAPPEVSLVELSVAYKDGEGRIRKRLVRVAHPKGWTGDYEAGGRSIWLYGPQGEGELLIAVATNPPELGSYLQELKRKHPGAAPSPPQFTEVNGVKPERGERATRFQITGREVGEMMMIERGGVIVLFSTIVAPNAWADVEKDMKRCYPTVQVVDAPPAPRP